MTLDVVVVGNAGVDTNVYLAGADVDWSRESNFTENRDYVGQAGGYAARGYAQLGYRTGFIGSLGDDPAGGMVRAAFARDGIDQRGVFNDPSGTARSVNIMGSDGSRKNFYDGRGHLDLDPPRATEILAGVQLVHMNLANWARHLIPGAHAAGATVACDLQDVADLDDPYRRAFVDGAHYLFASAANSKGEELARALMRRRPDATVVIGLGARGCAVADADGYEEFPAPPSDLPLVDTNGAGDSLAVGFLSARVLDGLPVVAAVARGQAAARWCCAQRASTDHLYRG
ncbi:carbohydrate kinase family protein [Tessaracoccus flavus]|uniref:Carbohydrate kinase PfkB domain-containing protein n=1 Tax=Tessaracoccus flavus TaxID=1610493 RepID=A0A1Q2CG57_9ACTN|nr:carbohydrate kinase family protein [Tessaracoccus flavus]AQP45096.1 hypothetical protein RPIT_10095 [Tessaracoccus flavus]SDY56583.1 2-dehydro-3-deoxygluconokinase [Tessaracoccus flavus]